MQHFMQTHSFRLLLCRLCPNKVRCWPAWRKCNYTAGDMQMKKLPGRIASSAELEAVHSSAHVATMKRKATEDAPCVVADFEETPDNTTYMAKSSFDDALYVRMLSFSGS